MPAHDSRVAGVTERSDARTVLQAHKLRTQLASAALMHGSGRSRGADLTLRVLVGSFILAVGILAGILIAGFIIDLIANGWVGSGRR